MHIALNNGITTKAQDIDWFESVRSNLSAQAFNQRKSMLKACLDWAIDNGLVSGKNPYKTLKPKKNERNDHVQPFSKDEVVAIIEAFQSDRFKPNLLFLCLFTF